MIRNLKDSATVCYITNQRNDKMSLIIILALIAVICLCAVFFTSGIRRFVSKISGGISAVDIKYAIDMAKEYEENPPIKSVSGATDMYLRRIKSDFPDFHFPEAKANVTTLINEYLPIRYSGYSSFSESEAEKYLISNVTKENGHKTVSDITVHTITISNYIKTEECATITYCIAVGCKLDGRNTEERYKIQSTFKFEEAGSPSQTLTCVNCGAPIKSSSIKYCEYCGSGIVWDTRRSWKFSAVEIY